MFGFVCDIYNIVFLTITLCSVWIGTDVSDEPAALSSGMEATGFSFTKLHDIIFYNTVIILL
jgi:hypothetical protein